MLSAFTNFYLCIYAPRTLHFAQGERSNLHEDSNIVISKIVFSKYKNYERR